MLSSKQGPFGEEPCDSGKQFLHTHLTYLCIAAIFQIKSRFFMHLHQLLYLDILLIDLFFILSDHLFGNSNLYFQIINQICLRFYLLYHRLLFLPKHLISQNDLAQLLL